MHDVDAVNHFKIFKENLHSLSSMSQKKIINGGQFIMIHCEIHDQQINEQMMQFEILLKHLWMLNGRLSYLTATEKVKAENYSALFD